MTKGYDKNNLAGAGVFDMTRLVNLNIHGCHRTVIPETLAVART